MLKILKERSESKKVSELSLLLVCQKKSLRHEKEEHGIAQHLQQEHNQSYLMHHYQKASIQGRQIQCRKDQIHIFNKDMNMVEQSSTVPSSLSTSSTKSIPWA